MTTGTPSIEVHPEKCSGCLSCQLACSFTNLKSFNPLKAEIIIDWRKDNSITFTPECTDCGVCVSYCHYGALERKGGS